MIGAVKARNCNSQQNCVGTREGGKSIPMGTYPFAKAILAFNLVPSRLPVNELLAYFNIRAIPSDVKIPADLLGTV